jgi:hypothetical protein
VIHHDYRKETIVSETHDSPGREDLERQFQTIRDDITTLSRLLREIGEAKAGEKRDAALAEAEALLDRSRAILDEGRTAREGGDGLHRRPHSGKAGSVRPRRAGCRFSRRHHNAALSVRDA